MDHARGTGVQLLLENVPFTFLPTAQDMADTAALIDPSVGVNFDVCNSAYIKEDPAAAIRMLGPLVKNVHISDSGYGDFKHERPGHRDRAAGACGQALAEIGYQADGAGDHHGCDGTRFRSRWRQPRQPRNPCAARVEAAGLTWRSGQQNATVAAKA